MLATTFWLPHSPPIPVGATLATGAAVLTVQFDRPLAPGVLAHGNWTTRGTNAGNRTGQPPCAAAGHDVTCSMTAALPDVGPDRCSYTPPPFDVQSTYGIPAAAFADYPLVVVP